METENFAFQLIDYFGGDVPKHYNTQSEPNNNVQKAMDKLGVPEFLQNEVFIMAHMLSHMA